MYLPDSSIRSLSEFGSFRPISKRAYKSLFEKNNSQNDFSAYFFLGQN